MLAFPGDFDSDYTVQMWATFWMLIELVLCLHKIIT